MLFLLTNVFYIFSFSQSECKVTMNDLVGSYKGECKNGLANGDGEARGGHYYKGSFKNGKPDGSGIFYYSDSVFFDGSFQDGIKEGKGEMHYKKKNQEDSVIKGYWSGDEYRGSKYTTYSFSTTETFDNIDISPSKVKGNLVTIEVSTTSGIPTGNPSPNYTGAVLSIANVISPTGSIFKITRIDGAYKSSLSIEMLEFPCQLFGTLSNGNTFSLDLYKAANWKVRFYKNK